MNRDELEAGLLNEECDRVIRTADDRAHEGDD